MTDNTAHFKKTMSQFATGVTIVTARAAEELGGLTLNSFNSVSLTPPMVSICVTKNTHSHDLIQRAGGYAVNILADGQEELARRFASVPGEMRFAGLDADVSPSGHPLIRGALAWLDVRTVHRYEGGDHTIFIGEVTAMEVLQPTSPPLIYFRSGFMALSA